MLLHFRSYPDPSSVSPVGWSSSMCRGLLQTLPRAASGATRRRAVGFAIVTDRSIGAVEVHPPSANSVNMAGVTVEYCPPRPAMG